MSTEPKSPPLTLDGIEHVLLLVNGLDRTLAFYEGVLGAHVESRLPKYAMVELRVGASHLDVVDTSVPEGAWALPPVAGGRNVDHIGLRVKADETVLRRHLAAHGVEIVEERANEAPAGVSLYVCDPSGNVVELMT
ncbi:MAG TPA: VOC family protein [Candidatus Cybelea sp.]